MIVKRHRTNNNFQIAYFIAGKCFTPDAAYIALLNQRDDRVLALNTARVQAMKNSARRLEIQRDLAHDDEIVRIRAQADQLEMDLNAELETQLIEAAQAELDFIDLCILRVQPLRKYRDLSDAEVAEVCQREEFALEFKNRIENFMITTGQIPASEFDSMRRHPDFNTVLLPHIEQVQAALTSPGGAQALLTAPTTGFDLPALLEMNHHAT